MGFLAAVASALVGGVGWVVRDVGGALARPGALDQDLAVGVGEGDGAGVPGRDHRGTGQVAVGQERDATDVDGAVAADGQLAFPGGTDGLVPMRPAPCGGVLLRAWASWSDGGGVVVRSGCLSYLGGVPGLLRGDAPGRALVRGRCRCRPRSRWGTSWAATPLLKTSMAAWLVSLEATREATARREWSSWSWKMTTLRPWVMTYSVASSCQQALGAG